MKSPGQIAYEARCIKRGITIPWESLDAATRANWDAGASMPPVGAVLNLAQGANVKTR